ncbi:hypothetical protein EVAR_31862_1 [Eumeta japonica]|uniref:Histone-lysine N-methyltransferase SETMAR n=1 Tax=Eumeta variegata TaxID=151549 RepID=A0A4C1Z2S8_EUMVA|nr:hypothetical protein EVAR_31862_1 [Eumeta japonica]
MRPCHMVTGNEKAEFTVMNPKPKDSLLRQNHHFGSLLPTGNEAQARSREKRARIDQQKRCGFHHDNARPHTSLATPLSKY